MDYLQYMGGNILDGEPKDDVLNLIINGLPSIPIIQFKVTWEPLGNWVLNLIINGLPSIPKDKIDLKVMTREF